MGVVLSIGISCSGDLLSKVAAKSGTGEAMTLSSSRYGDAAVEVIGGESYRFISKNRSVCSEYLYLRTSGEFAGGGMDDSGGWSPPPLECKSDVATASRYACDRGS